MRYDKIKQVKKVQVKDQNVTEVNEMLSQGWILLKISELDESDLGFILGHTEPILPKPF